MSKNRYYLFLINNTAFKINVLINLLIHDDVRQLSEPWPGYLNIFLFMLTLVE